jgi:hypothetical protein
MGVHLALGAESVRWWSQERSFQLAEQRVQIRLRHLGTSEGKVETSCLTSLIEIANALSPETSAAYIPSILALRKY